MERRQSNQENAELRHEVVMPTDTPHGRVVLMLMCDPGTAGKVPVARVHDPEKRSGQDMVESWCCSRESPCQTKSAFGG